MEYRILDLTLISAKGLKNASLIGKMNVYAVVSISSTAQKLKTPVNKGGGPNPKWNFSMKFTAMHNDTLIVKIKAARWFVNTELGQVHVPIKDLMDGVNAEGKTAMTQSVSFPVIRNGKPHGDIQLSYKVGEKAAAPAVETTKKAVATTSSGRPPQRRVKKGFQAVGKQVPSKNRSDNMGWQLAGTLGALTHFGGGGCGAEVVEVAVVVAEVVEVADAVVAAVRAVCLWWYVSELEVLIFI